VKMRLTQVKGAIVISGTAGSGKSTALMRVALKLTAQGNSVGWINPEGDLSPRDIRISASSHKEPHVVAIDDADIYGAELTPMMRELCRNSPYPLLLVTVRAG
jgi:Mrp family chromosome partitioning ATPase